MMYYLQLDWANREEYVNYFLNEFVPKNIPDLSKKVSTPWGGPPRRFWVFIQDQINNPKITALQDFLKTTFDFPDISYIVIFYLDHQSHIHSDQDAADNRTNVNSTSLNLQLRGYHGSRMEFFEPKEGRSGFIKNGAFTRLWMPDDVIKVAELELTQTWSLLNIQKLHNVINGDESNPKLCLSVRFKGDFPYEEAVNKIRNAIGTVINIV